MGTAVFNLLPPKDHLFKCKGMVWLDYILVLLAAVHLCSAIPFERAGSAFVVNFDTDADTTTFAFDVAADSAVVVTTDQTTEQTTEQTTDTNTATGSAFITDVTDTT